MIWIMAGVAAWALCATFFVVLASATGLSRRRLERETAVTDDLLEAMRREDEAEEGLAAVPEPEAVDSLFVERRTGASRRGPGRSWSELSPGRREEDRGRAERARKERHEVEAQQIRARRDARSA